MTRQSAENDGKSQREGEIKNGFLSFSEQTLDGDDSFQMSETSRSKPRDKKAFRLRALPDESIVSLLKPSLSTAYIRY